MTDNEMRLINALGILLRSATEITNIGAGSDSERRVVFRIPPEIYLEFSEAINNAMQTLRDVKV
jgi:hypothetical protein